MQQRDAKYQPRKNFRPPINSPYKAALQEYIQRWYFYSVSSEEIHSLRFRLRLRPGRKLRSVHSFFLSKSNPLRWALIWYDLYINCGDADCACGRGKDADCHVAALLAMTGQSPVRLRARERIRIATSLRSSQ